MQVVTPDLVKGKRVLLRLDLDVPLKEVGSGKWEVGEDFRLKAAIPTIKLCLENASQVIIMGHLGRPEGIEVPELSVAPIYDWLMEHDDFEGALENHKLRLLENLRFEKGEDEASEEYAKELASFGDPSTTSTALSTGSLGTGFFVNEAFAAYHEAASTTVLPKLLPYAAGLRFAKEVDRLTRVRENPKRPLVAVVGGAKVDDKYPQMLGLTKFCDKILVGGLLAKEIKEKNLEVPESVVLAQLNEQGIDLAAHSLGAFTHIIQTAKEVIWAGPVGKYEDPEGTMGNKVIAQAILASGAESVIGGGDLEAALSALGLLDKFDFVSVGGGAMLKFLAEGTLPSIEALG